MFRDVIDQGMELVIDGVRTEVPSVTDGTTKILYGVWEKRIPKKGDDRKTK